MRSVLTTSSHPHRTSPVLRGKWVMEQLLGISPPPPPQVVAELTEDKEKHEELGLRNILEIHRSNPACFSCHQKMDPLGLGLENSDANCTKTCFYLSFILLASSFIYEVWQIAYIDAIGSLGIAWYAFKEGKEAFDKSRKQVHDNCNC